MHCIRVLAELFRVLSANIVFLNAALGVNGAQASSMLVARGAALIPSVQEPAAVSLIVAAKPVSSV